MVMVVSVFSSSIFAQSSLHSFIYCEVQKESKADISLPVLVNNFLVDYPLGFCASVKLHLAPKVVCPMFSFLLRTISIPIDPKINKKDCNSKLFYLPLCMACMGLTQIKSKELTSRPMQGLIFGLSFKRWAALKFNLMGC